MKNKPITAHDLPDFSELLKEMNIKKPDLPIFESEESEVSQNEKQ